MTAVSLTDFQQHIRSLGIPGYGDDEVEFMYETVALVRPSHIFEWGTNRGSSARILYEAARDRKMLSCQVHTTDLPTLLCGINKEHVGSDTGCIFAHLEGITQHYGDGVTCSLLAFREARNPRSLFFIDGDHNEENVLRELRWINLVAPSEAILLHDTHPGARPSFGPFHALNIFLAGEGVKYDVTYLNSQAGMTRLTA